MSSVSILERIAAGRTDLALDAIDTGAATLATRVDRATLFQWCAWYGDVTAVRMLLARGAAVEELGTNLGLQAASFHGHWRLCQYLLERGARAAEADPTTGETPLHAATTTEDRARYDLVVSVLLAAGADSNAASLSGQPTGAFMRDSRTRGETPLHRAAAFGTVGTIRLLLEAGADLARPDAAGDTPLAWASWHRRPPDVIRVLCYGPHAVHAEYRPMHVSLLGKPL